MRQIKINDTLGSEIISVADAKLFIRIDTNADDGLLDDMIVEARIVAENYMSRDIVSKDRTYYLDYSHDGLIDVPFGPIESIEEVTVRGEIVSFTEYGLGDTMIELEGNARDIKINYITEGMSDGLLKQVLLQMVSTYYDNRTDFVTGTIQGDLPSNYKRILDGYKSVFI
jgi:hypothetical protein